MTAPALDPLDLFLGSVASHAYAEELSGIRLKGYDVYRIIFFREPLFEHPRVLFFYEGARLNSIGGGRIADLFEGLDPDLYRTLRHEAEFFRRAVGKVEDPALGKRAPVVHLNLDALVIIEVRDANVRAERQRPVRGGNAVHVVRLPVCRLPAVKVLAVPG